MEKRITLLQDISAEFSIQWDSKAFTQRMEKPSTLPPQPASKKPVFEKNDTPLTIKSSFRDRNPEVIDTRDHDDRLFRGRKEKHIENGDNDGRLFSGTRDKKNGFENSISPLPGKSSGSSYADRTPDDFEKDMMKRGRKERHIENGDNVGRLFRGTRESYKKNGFENSNSPLPGKSSGSSYPDRTLDDFENDMVKRGRKERHKENASNDDRRPEILVNDCANQEDDFKTRKVPEEEAADLKSRYDNSLPPPYVKSNVPPPYSKLKDRESKKELDHGSTHRLREDHRIPLPKPRSMRRKYSKSSSSHDDIGSSENAQIKRISSSKRKERKGLQILFDDEEKMMDKLLLHYSKKPSAFDAGKLKKKTSRSAASKSPQNGSEIVGPPARSISLPHEQTSEPEPAKVYARANSFQPDNQARHVHPKLPDYDDLAARFAALRGR